MAIKHKQIRRCERIVQSMMKAHNLGPGSLFFFKKNQENFICFNVEIDQKTKVVTNKPKIQENQRLYSYYKVPAKEPLLFVDVVFDPVYNQHWLRFLHNQKMIALLFIKNKTIKELKVKLEKVLPSNKGQSPKKTVPFSNDKSKPML